jgi:hypothetical protein
VSSITPGACCWPTADAVGLTSQLGRRANLGRRAGAHDRGVVLRDLVVILADGGRGLLT